MRPYDKYVWSMELLLFDCVFIMCWAASTTMALPTTAKNIGKGSEIFSSQIAVAKKGIQPTLLIRPKQVSMLQCTANTTKMRNLRGISRLDKPYLQRPHFFVSQPFGNGAVSLFQPANDLPDSQQNAAIHYINTSLHH